MKAKSKTIPYRALDGYIIKKYVPYVQGTHKRHCNGYETQHVARYVYCPEREGLVSLNVCKGCPQFSQFRRDGIKCRTDKPIDAGAYYDGRTDEDRLKVNL